MADIVANFTLNQNNNVNATFELSEPEQFDALFQINAGLKVVGEGNINVVTAGGTATVTSTTFVFEQGVASAEWEIVHNLNKRPSITVVDSAGTVVIGHANYINDNTVIVTFNAPFTGKAYLN